MQHGCWNTHFAHIPGSGKYVPVLKFPENWQPVHLPRRFASLRYLMLAEEVVSIVF